MAEIGEKIRRMKELIEQRAIVKGNQKKIISPNGLESDWIFDIKKIFLDPEVLDLIADIFWEKFKNDYPFQVGGQEVASIPIISAIVVKSRQIGHPVNGFFIRKSRKTYGLQKIIEGTVDDKKIILVDDLINSGQSAEHQIKILDKERKTISSIFTLVRFREPANYKFLIQKKICLKSLFSLADFGLKLRETDAKYGYNYFNSLWYFQSPDPDMFYTGSKSTPILDDKKIYFGSDAGIFWALNQKDGSVAWKHKVWWFKRKGIFSSPAIWKDYVYFGAYDGNIYCLNKKTGERIWRFLEADWVGSSPVIAENLGMLFVGLEFGLVNKHGGIAALDLKTGKKIWEHKMTEFVHCTPSYWPEKKLVAIGGNDGTAYLFNAKNGKLVWSYQTKGDIKYSLTFDIKRNALVFGSLDGYIYIVNIATGKLVRKFEASAGVYATPLIWKEKIITASLDKRIYCLNPEKGEPEWIFEAGGRIFSTPVLIEDHIFFGATDGKMYELNPHNGKLISYFQVTERILNEIIYNSETKRFFFATQANEIYCIARQFFTNFFIRDGTK